MLKRFLQRFWRRETSKKAAASSQWEAFQARVKRLKYWLTRQLIKGEFEVLVVFGKDNGVWNITENRWVYKNESYANRLRESVFHLRWKVFCKGKKAQTSPENNRRKREKDAFDDKRADYLLMRRRYQFFPCFQWMFPKVLNKAFTVGTYRLIQGRHIEHWKNFYTATEYDLHSLLQEFPNAVEASRLCILEKYQGRTLNIIFEGMAAYMAEVQSLVLFGTGSFWGTDPQEYAEALTLLAEEHTLPPEIAPRALEYQSMRLASLGTLDKEKLLKDKSKIPSIISIYIKWLNARFGDGASIDNVFGSVDVLLVVRIETLTPAQLRVFDKTGELAALLEKSLQEKQ